MRWKTGDIKVLPKPLSACCLDWKTCDWELPKGMTAQYKYHSKQLDLSIQFDVNCDYEKISSLFLCPSKRVEWDFYLSEMSEYQMNDQSMLEFSYKIDRVIHKMFYRFKISQLGNVHQIIMKTLQENTDEFIGSECSTTLTIESLPSSCHCAWDFSLCKAMSKMLYPDLVDESCGFSQSLHCLLAMAEDTTPPVHQPVVNAILYSCERKFLISKM